MKTEHPPVEASSVAPDAVDPVSAEGVGKAGRPHSADTGVEHTAEPAAKDRSEAIRQRRKPRGEKDRADLPNWAEVLKFCHAIIALRVSELEISDQEAAALAGATMPLMDRYGIPMVPSWAKDWVVLGATLNAIYAPRFAAIAARNRREREAKMRTINPQPAQPDQPIQPGSRPHRQAPEPAAVFQ